MKIGSPIDTAAVGDASLRPQRAAGTAAPAAAVAATDQVAVSAAGTQLGALASSDFDSKKVDAIRQAIREGRFTVNPEAIADRLIADAAALVSPRGH